MANGVQVISPDHLFFVPDAIPQILKQKKENTDCSIGSPTQVKYAIYVMSATIHGWKFENQIIPSTTVKYQLLYWVFKLCVNEHSVF